MSLSLLLSAYAELIGDVIVNDAAQPVPARMLRYHGRLPDDCCPAEGSLGVWWDSGVPTSAFPTANSGQNTKPCMSAPMVDLWARYVVCWPAPDADSEGMGLLDDQWDDIAATLADVADTVARALIRLDCFANTVVPADDERSQLIAALLAQTARASFRYVGVSPIVPAGGCVGIEWHAYAMPTAAGPVS